MRINPAYDYREHLEGIADGYAALIADETTRDASGLAPDEFGAWKLLGAHSLKLATMIRHGMPVGLWPDGLLTVLRVRETDDAEPYPDASAMLADLWGGEFVVSRANSEHPVWTPAENVAFRIVHDVLGHGSSGGGFDWYGENAACGAHFPILPIAARPALFTECIAQTGYAIARGGFGPQCVGFLPGLAVTHGALQFRPVAHA